MKMKRKSKQAKITVTSENDNALKYLTHFTLQKWHQYLACFKDYFYTITLSQQNSKWLHQTKSLVFKIWKKNEPELIN